tara:strand:+ start:315 stop:1163 length:849 start_codon:yes stop_codon:yes gene_type:complete
MKSIKSEIINKTSIWVNSLLASDFSRKFENWFGSLTESSATVYDKAVDAAYNATHIGGWKHRLFDGHQPFEMWETVKNVKIDDSRKQELEAFVKTFFKDFNTHAGLPFYTLSKDSYDKAAIFLHDKFFIPKDWFYDIQTLNGSELIASSLGVLGVVFNWNKKDAKLFGDLVSSLMMAGAIGGNPITVIISIIMLGRHFHLEKNKKKFSKKFLEGTKIGSLSLFSFLGISSFVGGPVWLGLILGLIIAVLVRKHSNKLNITPVYEWFRDSLKSLFSSAYNTLV